MPTISIIIPIYNAELYLAECLDSIINQDFQDYEALLIDDGSTDGSSTLCKEFQCLDTRFHYFCQENGGVSKARNTGLAHATGQWFYFVDADDTLPAHSLSTLWKLSKNNSVELTMGRYTEIDEYQENKSKKQSFELQLDRVNCTCLLFLTHEYGYQGYLWNKLFKASIIHQHHLRFNESFHFNEDRLFCIEYICAMKGLCVFTSQIVYEYHRRLSSVMGKARQSFNPNIYDDYESSLVILQTLKQQGFSHRVINLARDRIIDSYDFIRHNMCKTHYSEAKHAIHELRRRAINDTSYIFFICNRIRRFLSKQVGHLMGRVIYFESIF